MSRFYKKNAPGDRETQERVLRSAEQNAPGSGDRSKTSRGERIDRAAWSVQLSCMGRTITIDDNAYKLLSSLKRGSGDSFTKVILRHVNRPADTGGELAELIEKLPPPDVDPDMLDRIEKERGRRS